MKKSYFFFGFVWLLLGLVGLAFAFLGMLFASEAEQIMSLEFVWDMIVPGGIFYIFQFCAAIYCFARVYD